MLLLFEKASSNSAEHEAHGNEKISPTVGSIHQCLDPKSYVLPIALKRNVQCCFKETFKLLICVLHKGQSHNTLGQVNNNT